MREGRVGFEPTIRAALEAVAGRHGTGLLRAMPWAGGFGISIGARRFDEIERRNSDGDTPYRAWNRAVKWLALA